VEIRVEAFEDPGAVLEIAERALTARPVESNLALTTLHDRIAGPEPGHYWIASDDNGIAAVGIESPPRAFLIVTPAPAATLGTLVDTLMAETPDLRGVFAEVRTAAVFAGTWAERRGVEARPVEGGRIYRLDKPPVPQGAAGTLRLAHDGDREQVRAWARAFDAESGNNFGQAEAMVTLRLASGRVFLWDDGGPASMASATAAVGGVCRIAHVYTPPALRSHGYGKACVADLSGKLLATEAEACMLFSHFHHPGSNRIYRSVGYEAVGETLVYEFTP
jgi:GNAT superfamily N-acetyltransferase